MDQLIFKFPFSKKYYEQDFYVSSNNFSAYKLVESWPNWPGKWLNIFGSKGSGKTHLAKILEKKIDKIKLIDASNITHGIIQNLFKLDCLIIDNYNNNIDEKLLYSILNQSKQLENYILINSIITMKNITMKNMDLFNSRFDSYPGNLEGLTEESIVGIGSVQDWFSIDLDTDCDADSKDDWGAD